MRAACLQSLAMGLVFFPTLLATAAWASPIPSAALAPAVDDVAAAVIVTRQLNNTDLGDFSPIEDGFLEGDSDSGGESATGGDAVSVANGLTGGGSGSASHSNGSSTGTSSYCSVSGCTSGAGAANQNNASTSTDSSSITVVGGSVVGGPVVSGPLVVVGSRIRRLLRV